MRRLAAVVAGLALAGTAGAAHPSRAWTVLANLDSDRARERVTFFESVSSSHSAAAAGATIGDTCRGRERLRTFQVRRDTPFPTSTGGGPDLRQRAVADLDGSTRRREVFVEASADGSVYAAVVRMDRGGRRCAVARVLFRYSSDEPLGPPPAGLRLADARVTLVEPAAAGSGKGVAVFERYADCTWRTTEFRYDQRAGRYAQRRTELELPGQSVQEPPDLAALAEELRRPSLPMCPKGLATWSLLGAEAWPYANPGGWVTFFAFDSEADANAVEITSRSDIRRRLADGTIVGAHIDWIPGAEPHWFRRGRILVLFAGSDAATLTRLRDTLEELWPRQR